MAPQDRRGRGLARTRRHDCTSGDSYEHRIQTTNRSGSVASQLTTLEIPEASNVIASYPIAVVRGADSPELAKAFVDLVESATGQESLKKAGFIPVQPATQPSQ